MKDTSLKLLAKRARDRLKTAGEYSAKAEKTAYLAATSSYIMVANIRKIEDDPLFAKVKRLMEKSSTELVINPLSYLIDNKVYKTLSGQERERYMLKLSKKYNTIKEYIVSNNLLSKDAEMI